MSEQPEGTSNAPKPTLPDQILTDQTLSDQIRMQHVSDELKSGFAALAGPGVPDDVKPRWHQRLIAITNSAKHDLATAEKRLVTYWSDWEDQVGPRP